MCTATCQRAHASPCRCVHVAVQTCVHSHVSACTRVPVSVRARSSAKACAQPAVPSRTPPSPCAGTRVCPLPWRCRGGAGMRWVGDELIPPPRAVTPPRSYAALALPAPICVSPPYPPSPVPVTWPGTQRRGDGCPPGHPRHPGLGRDLLPRGHGGRPRRRDAGTPVLRTPL